jgi:hypothetical protein
MNPGKAAFQPIPMFPIAPTVPIVLKKKAWNMRIVLQNPPQLFNARSQKGKNSRMRELLFNQDAGPKYNAATPHWNVRVLPSYRYNAVIPHGISP